MLNQSGRSQPSCARALIQHSPSNSSQHDAKAARRHALLNDDWATFERYAHHDDPDGDIATERYENGQNGLHLAIRLGSPTIAIQFITWCSQHAPSLLTGIDDAGCTPLMAAVEGPTDRPELVQALLDAGVRNRLTDALKLAALAGHAQAAACLVQARVNASIVLAKLLGDNHDAAPHAIARAMPLLLSLGATVDNALDYAAESFNIAAVCTLLLLGAKGANALATTAQQQVAISGGVLHGPDRTRKKIATLLVAGADIIAALIDLAQPPQARIRHQAARCLILANYRERRRNAHSPWPHETTAVVRLASAADIPAMLVLRRAIAPENLGWKALAIDGNVNAIKALIGFAPRNQLDDLLQELAVQGQWIAIKTLITAGVDPSTAADNLLNDQQNELPREFLLPAIKLLIIAGAHTVSLPADITHAVAQRKADIATLTPNQRNAALLQALAAESMWEIALLFEQEVDLDTTLNHLIQHDDLHDLCQLAKAGALSSATLIQQFKTGDPQVAASLAKIDELAIAALEDCLAAEDLQTAHQLIGALRSPRDVLIYAALNNRPALACALLSINPDGGQALPFLIQTGDMEAAGRLVAWGVDIHSALIQAASNREEVSRPLINDLQRIGADPRIAVTRALELNHGEIVQRLLQDADPAVGQHVVLTLINDQTLNNDTKRTRLSLLFQHGVDAPRLLQTLINNHQLATLRKLIALGAPTEALLIDSGRRGDRLSAQTLILAGGDVFAAITTLGNNHEQNAVNVLMVAMAVAREQRLSARTP